MDWDAEADLKLDPVQIIEEFDRMIMASQVHERWSGSSRPISSNITPM